MLIHRGTELIYTERLVLRQFQRGDEQEMFENYCSDPKVTEHQCWEPDTDVFRTCSFLKYQLACYEDEPLRYYSWAMQFEGHVIGSISAFDIDERAESCEIGYSMGSKYWNRGLATEAAKAVLKFLFEEVGFNRVVAQYAADNTGSGRVMYKIGMRNEGTLRQAMKNRSGDYEDLQQYSILREDYWKMKENAQ